MENKSINQEDQQPSSNVKRKGLFPRLSLKKTLELPKAIYSIGQGEPVRRVIVFDSIGKSANSGPSRTLVTVSAMYGLTNGGYKADYLNLTEIGRQLVLNEDLKLIYEVLFKNEIFSKFINYWKDKTIPEDVIASDWLLRTEQLTQEDSKAFWEIIKENIKDYKLIEHLSGKEIIVSKEVAMKSYETKTTAQDEYKAIASESSSVKLTDNSSKVESTKPMQAHDIDLEKGGIIRIIAPGYKDFTKDDVRRIKAQIDVISNFIDQNQK